MGSLLECGLEDKQGDLGGHRWGQEFLVEGMAGAKVWELEGDTGMCF